MIIKKAVNSDLHSILELQYLAYQSEAKLVNNFLIPPLVQTIQELMKEYERGLILKATENADGEIIGSVRAYIDGNTAFIGKLIVHPNNQRKGIGTALLLEIEKQCKAERYELFTSDKSVLNIKLYERLGYKKFRKQKMTPDINFIYLEKYNH